MAIGAADIAEMKVHPALNQRCLRCGEHFGLACKCTREELREYVGKLGMPGEVGFRYGGVDKAPATVDKAETVDNITVDTTETVDKCATCQKGKRAPARTQCYACLQRAYRERKA